MTTTSNNRLANKVIMIAGAGRGIGAEAARLFAGQGASVVLAARTEAQLIAVRDEIVASGGEAAYFAADLSQASSVERAVRFTVERYGRLDGAFNNAGIAINVASLIDEQEEDFDVIQSVNYKSVWLCMKAQIKAILETAGSGSIVNTSSVGSLKGNPGLGAYGAAKRAVNSLTQTAAVEYGPSGIRVNAIAPGTTMTDMIQQWVSINPEIIEQISGKPPLRRAAEPIEIAQAASWLLSDESSFVTGVVLPVDGGLSA